MDLLTFGQIILFEDNHYVWLAPDPEDSKLHLAQILDKEKTKKLIGLDKSSEKKHLSVSYNSPIFAYIVLTTEDFDGRVAHLMNSDNHTDNDDGCSIMGKLNDEDTANLKKRILEGNDLPPRLVNLIKKLV